MEKTLRKFIALVLLITVCVSTDCMISLAKTAPLEGFELLSFTNSTASSGSLNDDITWTLDEAGTLTISGMGEIKRKSILGDSDQAEKVIKIIIEDGITAIGNQAFTNCINVTGVIIGNSVTSIGEYAFSECTKLTEIALPESLVEIGLCAFMSSGLEDITIPDSVITIGNSAFFACENLVSVILGNNVTTIGSGAFQNCDSLTSIVIPDCVTSLGTAVFSNCISLTDVVIGNGMLELPESTFASCSSLTNVTISDGITVIDNAAFFSCDALTSITIPDTVESIGDRAFLNCGNLESIEFSQTLQTIGEDAFSDCKKLESIELPESLVSIGEKAFLGCESLEEIYLSSGITVINSWTFAYCYSLTSISIPSSVTSIGENAFYDCENMTQIFIPVSVTSFGSGSFGSCSSLEAVYYSGTVEEWKQYIKGNANVKNSSLTKATVYYECSALGVPSSVGEILITKYDEDQKAYVSDFDFLLLGDSVILSVEVTVDEDTSLTFQKTNWVCTAGEKENSALDFGNLSVLGPYTSESDASKKVYYVSVTATVVSVGEYTVTFQSPDGGISNRQIVIYENGTFITFSATLYSKTNPEYCLIDDTIELYGSIGSKTGEIDVTEELAAVTWEFDEPGAAEVVSCEIVGTDLSYSDIYVWKLTLRVIRAGDITVKGTTSGGSSAEYIFTAEPEIKIDVSDHVYKLYDEDQVITCTVELNVADEEYLASFGSQISCDFKYDGVHAVNITVENENCEIAEDGCSAVYKWYPVASLLSGYSGMQQNEVTVVLTTPGEQEKKKTTTARYGFYVPCDGWSLINARASFGYDRDYKIDWSYYFNTFGFTAKSSINSIANKWGGSCFGLSLLAVANYNSQIDLSNYFNIVGSTLNTYGYNSIEYMDNENGTGYIYAVNDSAVIEMIERAQVSQYSKDIKEAEVFNGDSDYSELLEYLGTEGALPLVVTLEACMNYKFYRHVVVLDTTVEPVQIKDGKYQEYRLLVYDCNRPILTNELENQSSFYNNSSDPAVLEISTNGGWILKEDGKTYMSAEYSCMGTIEIRFYDISKLDSSFFYGEMTFLDFVEDMFSFGSSVMQIEDEDGETIFEIGEEGCISYKEELDYTFYASSGEETDQAQGYITPSAGKYTIKTEDESSVLRICGDDYLVAWETDGSTTVYLDDTSRSITLNNTDAEKMEFAVAIQDVDATVAGSVEGTLDGNTSLSLQITEDEDGNLTVVGSTTSGTGSITSKIERNGSTEELVLVKAAIDRNTFFEGTRTAILVIGVLIGILAAVLVACICIRKRRQ